MLSESISSSESDEGVGSNWNQTYKREQKPQELPCNTSHWGAGDPEAIMVVCQQPQTTTTMSTANRDKLIILFLISYTAAILCTHSQFLSSYITLTSNHYSLWFNPSLPKKSRSCSPSFHTTMVQGLLQWSARNITTTLVSLLLLGWTLLSTPCCALVHLGTCNQFTKGPCSFIGLVCSLSRQYSYLSIRVLSQPTYEPDWENNVNFYLWTLRANL